MNHAELVTQRRLTSWFIEGDPVSISLVRATSVATAAGGKRKGAPTTLPAQRLRLSAAGRSTPIPAAANEAGPVPIHPYVLIGPYNADIEEGDEFELNGQWYQVRKVEPNRVYETRAGVDYRGASG